MSEVTLGKLLPYLPGKKWIHQAIGVETREEAIDQMFEEYERHKKYRRLPSREAFEVYRTKNTSMGWLLYVRLKRKGGEE